VVLLKTREVINPPFIVPGLNPRVLELKLNVRKIRPERGTRQTFDILEDESTWSRFPNNAYSLGPHVTLIGVGAMSAAQ
jgi:hypothetical protein